MILEGLSIDRIRLSSWLVSAVPELAAEEAKESDPKAKKFDPDAAEETMGVRSWFCIMLRQRLVLVQLESYFQRSLTELIAGACLSTRA